MQVLSWLNAKLSPDTHGLAKQSGRSIPTVATLQMDEDHANGGASHEPPAPPPPQAPPATVAKVPELPKLQVKSAQRTRLRVQPLQESGKVKARGKAQRLKATSSPAQPKVKTAKSTPNGSGKAQMTTKKARAAKNVPTPKKATTPKQASSRGKGNAFAPDNQEIFAVEAVLDVKYALFTTKKELLFKVRWAAPYNSTNYDTWEPYKNVKHLKVLDKFATTSQKWAFFKSTAAYREYLKGHPLFKLPRHEDQGAGAAASPARLKGGVKKIKAAAKPPKQQPATKVKTSVKKTPATATATTTTTTTESAKPVEKAAGNTSTARTTRQAAVKPVKQESAKKEVARRDKQTGSVRKRQAAETHSKAERSVKKAKKTPAAADDPGPADNEEIFEVDAVQQARVDGKKLSFKVRWGAPYDTAEHDTWEPLKNVKHLKVLDDYLSTPGWAAFKASSAYQTLLKKHPNAVPASARWR